jgi:predicted RNase H-like HicB family nuclease
MRLFKKKAIDRDELFALRWKRPDVISVLIEKDENGGYFAKITNFNGDNVVTQAQTGRELVEMVNEAMYDYLDIPQQYREYLGYFMPPIDVRDEFGAEIPAKYLHKTMRLVGA